MTLRSSATEWLTAVRWAIGFSSVCSAIAPVTWTVPSRVDPPAPYVTETNVGLSCSRRRMALPELPLPLVGLRREELERERPARLEHVGDARRAWRVRARRVCWGASDASGCRGLGGMCPSITQWSSFCAGTTTPVHLPGCRKPGQNAGTVSREWRRRGQGRRPRPTGRLPYRHRALPEAQAARPLRLPLSGAPGSKRATVAGEAAASSGAVLPCGSDGGRSPPMPGCGGRPAS